MSRVKNVDVVWSPHVGPQTFFLQCPAFECLYGGAVGGGKTDALLGDWLRDAGRGLGSAWRGVFFRRSFPDMDDVIARSMEIFGPLFGAKCYNKSKYEWNLPDGERLAFRSIENAADVSKHQGQQYCVAEGTLVRMAGGAMKPIEDIEAGDMVETLNGPREVLVVHGAEVRECVVATVRDDDGCVVGRQVHPTNHPIMTADGEWATYASLEGDPSSDTGSSSRRRGELRPRPLSVRVALHGRRPRGDASSLRSPTECRASCKSSGPSSTTSGDQTRELVGQQPPFELHRQPRGGSTLSLREHGVSYGQHDWRTGQGSRCDCSSCLRLRGELPQLLAVGAEGGPPSRACAEAHTQTCCTQDGQGNAPEHTQCCEHEYVHPYTGEIRTAVRVSYGSCEMTPCGEAVVYDLTVSDEAHYITEHGLVNRNSWVGWDELTQWNSPYAYTYLMTRVRSAKGANVRVRAATNPGGPGHSWVKNRFVDIGPAGSMHQVVTRKGDYYRCFIPAKLEDNHTLMENDPSYGDRVYELNDENYAEALRQGRWDIVAGAAFTEWNSRIHVVPTAPIPRDAIMWRALDWGYSEPYACLFMFMDNEGDVNVARELYGYGGAPNVGSEESPDIVREKIVDLQRSAGMNCPEGFVDGGTMDRHGHSETIYEMLGGMSMNWKPWPKYNGSRANNKTLLHSLMKVVNGRSRLKIQDCCTHLIRTLPTLPVHPNNPEDIAAKCEDHAYDALVGGLSAKKLPTADERRRQQIIMKMNEMEGVRHIESLPVGGGF